MLHILLILALICAGGFLVFKCAGTLLKILIWLVVMFPLSLISWVLGIVLCCTIILIPLGLIFLKAGTSFFVPAF